MYAGTTFRTKSGRVMGVHQRIDRLARQKLTHGLSHDAKKIVFPAINDILHFEGKNGPDGIKSKSPAKDEPWHFVDPDNEQDTVLYEHITNHIINLSQALREENHERAAFEAAWLSHAIVDGLTPAHQYPLSDKIEALWGKPKEERLTVFDKNIIRGANSRDTIGKNWQYWGARGVFTTHYLFEWGFAAATSTQRYTGHVADTTIFETNDSAFIDVYKRYVLKVRDLKMYELYHKNGWTSHLASMSREKLMPLIIDAVALAWYKAIEDAV